MSSSQKVIKYCAFAFAIALTITIFTGIVSIIVGVLNGVTDGKGTDKVISYSEEFTNVKSLYIDSGEIPVKIEAGNEFKVDATNVPEQFRVNLSKDGTLNVGKEEEDDWLINLNLSFFDSNNDAEVVITLPYDFIAEKAVIDSGSASVDIDSLYAKDLKVDSGSGKIYIDTVSAENANIDSGSGAVTIQKAKLNDLVLNSGSGSVDITGVLTGESYLDCGSGNLTISMLDSIDHYDIDCDSGSGGIWIAGEKENDYNNHNNSAPNSIEVDGGSGRIVLDFIK